MKRALAALIVGIMAVSMAACGSEPAPSTSVAEAEKEYVDESEMTEFFTNPDKFKGKYVVLSGAVLSEPEQDGDIVAYQAYADPVNYEQTFIFGTSTEEELLGDGDYFFLQGRVKGTFTGENLMGGEIKCPVIEDCNVTKSTYMDVVVPTISSIEPAMSQEQHDVTVVVDKVEYAEKETRLYLSITNNTDEEIGFGSYSIKVVQDGKQYESEDELDSAYYGNYPELDYEVSAGVTTSGVVVLPAIDPAKDYTIVVPDFYSDDWETEFDDFTFEVKSE